MHLRRTLVLATLLIAAAPAVAHADAPWTAPATVPGASGYATPIAVTPAGHAELATTDATSANGQRTLLTPLGTDGTLGTGRQVAVVAGRLAAYGRDHLLVAGTTPAVTAAQAARARVLVVTLTPGGAASTPRALPGTTRQQLLAVAGGPDGTAALVTGTVTGPRERVVWIRRGGVTRRALTIRVGQRARGAAVAVGAKGDVLVVYEDDHQVFSRHLGPTGRAAAAHRLGAGVQSLLQARITESGRQEVAWSTQRVDEGDATSPAVVSYASAARGHGFTRAQVVGGSPVTGTGRYVAAPGVRLVGSGSDSSVLALTTYDGAHFRTAVASAVAGRVGSPELVSPEGEDDVLGDLAYARAGGTLVLWRTATRGSDPNGHQRVVARVRPAGAAAFGPAEAVSPAATAADDGTNVPYAPAAAVDPVTGRSLAGFGELGGHVAVTARPAG